jgi:hypothetical protein
VLAAIEPALSCVPAIAAWVSLWLGMYSVTPDTFLCLVMGRDIAQHGLPSTDQFTLLSHGEPWVDQPWLAHLLIYFGDAQLGMGALIAARVMLSVVLCFFCLAHAARRGAGTLALFAGGVAGLALTIAKAKLRAQLFAEALFVGLLWLLFKHVRAPSWRTSLGLLAILSLWGNFHGSVLLGVALVWLATACACSEVVTARGIAGTWALPATRLQLATCVLALGTPLVSPYGLQLVDYYLQTAANPAFRQYLVEWAPPDLRESWLSIAIAAATALGLALSFRRLARFELALLALLLVMSLTSVRHELFFGYALMFCAPSLIQLRLPPRAQQLSGGRVLAAIGGILVVAAAVLSLPAARVYRSLVGNAWPAATSAKVAQLAGPNGHVFAEFKHADRLLWHEPTLAGRIAYDARFELLQGDDIVAITRAFAVPREGMLRDYRVIVVADALKANALAEAGFARAARDPQAQVFVTPAD